MDSMQRTLHTFLGFLVAGIVTFPAQVSHAQRRIRVVPPTVIPKNFKTRKVGVSLNITAVGTARSVVVRAGSPPLVELTMDGKTHRTFPGRYVKVGKVAYKAMGWQKDYFLLFSATKKQSLYFTRAEEKKKG